VLAELGLKTIFAIFQLTLTVFYFHFQLFRFEFDFLVVNDKLADFEV